MQPISFDSISYRSGAQRVFLMSGEIHYFRVPREQWRERLELYKATGGNCIATYVPWLLHEPEPGRFVFAEDPQLDVEAFLQLCAEVGLWAIVRPGPYQYSELAYDGLPGWLCEQHPELRAHNATGETFRVSSMSYLHPDFLTLAKRWFDQVLPRLVPHQTGHGGAVAAVQIDNELMGIHEWFGSWDYTPAAMGVGHDEGRWPDFLRARHGSLEAVNAAHGLQATRWAEVAPLAVAVVATPAERRRLRDYQECYFSAIADYAETLAGWLREAGFTVPIVHNSGSPYMNSYFRETVQRLGPSFLLGSDHYYNLDMDWDQNNPTPKYASKCFYSNEMLRLYGVPPTVFELPGGSASEYPPVTPTDALCAYLLNVAYGMKGYNYYIFTGGFNRPDTGTTGEVYDYGAAVSATGELRPLYYAQQALARLLTEHAWLAGAERVADCHLGLDWEGCRAGHVERDRRHLDFTQTGAWLFLRKGFMMTAFCASHSPTFADLTSDTLLAQIDRPLLVAGSVAMAAAVQLRLIAFLERGGKLLLAPLVPTLDEAYQPCRLLADYLGVEQAPCTPMAPLLTAFGIHNVQVNGGLFASVRRPAAAEVTAREERTGAEIGWELVLPGGGKVSVLGLHWKMSRREHASMLTRALARLGHQPVVTCDNPNVWTSLRSDGTRTMLFMLNLLSAPMAASVRYRDPASGEWVDTGRHELPGITVQLWCDGRTVDLGDWQTAAAACTPPWAQ